MARPLWLFDSPLLRAALAQVNLAAVPAIIRAASGLSQSDLAAIAGWSRGALGLYERGQRGAVFDIRVVLQFAEAVDMPREALLPLVLGDADCGLVADCGVDETGVDVDRRSFGGLTAGVAVAAILPEPTIPPRVTASHIKYLQACADSLYSRDQTIGGAALLESALRQWRRARRMLKESSYTETVGRQLFVVAGEMAVCVGWLAFDGGNVPLARKLYTQAQQVADLAGNSSLTAHVLVMQSRLASYSARMTRDTGKQRRLANEGWRLACQAAEEARYEPFPKLHSLIAFRHANAASLLGNAAAVGTAFTRARRELDRGSRTDEPEWIRFVDEDEITGQEAMACVNLGDPARGEKLCRMVLSDELSRRNRAAYDVELAVSLLGQGARHDALSAASAALSAFEDGMTSVRTLNELRPVRLAAGSMNESDFCERHDAIERGLSDFHAIDGR